MNSSQRTHCYTPIQAFLLRSTSHCNGTGNSFQGAYSFSLVQPLISFLVLCMFRSFSNTVCGSVPELSLLPLRGLDLAALLGMYFVGRHQRRKSSETSSNPSGVHPFCHEPVNAEVKHRLDYLYETARLSAYYYPMRVLEAVHISSLGNCVLITDHLIMQRVCQQFLAYSSCTSLGIIDQSQFLNLVKTI